MKFGLLLIMLAFASENRENKTESTAKSEEKVHGKNDDNLILVKIEENEYTKEHKIPSRYIGVTYTRSSTWETYRWSKAENKNVHNGTYKDEETAAHASDTLARKLMANGEQNHKLNFPDDHTEVYRPRQDNKFIGVFLYPKGTIIKWAAQRWSNYENKNVFNGYYKDEETAALASDTLARNLMKNRENNLNLNFPDKNIEVYPEKKSSKYIGVVYKQANKKWKVQRWNKKENKIVFNGYYKDEKTAAHASDTLARKFMANGEQNLKLNFPDTEKNAERGNKRKRSDGHSQNE